MRIIYLSVILLGFSPWVIAEPIEQQSWQDIVRSTQERKQEEVPAEPEKPDTKTLYKVVDENGVPSFTDVAPAAQNAESFEIESKPSLNVLGDKSQQRQQYERKLIQQAQYRKQQAEQHRQAIQQAKLVLETAQKRQTEGESPVDGEWQHNSSGRRFLKESYFARQKALKDAVEKAQKNLETLHRK